MRILRPVGLGTSCFTQLKEDQDELIVMYYGKSELKRLWRLMVDEAL